MNFLIMASCYNVYGVFQDNELYQKTFGDEAKREKFLRWRVQLLENGIQQQLSFSPGGISSMVQITDLKNSAATLGKKELKQAADQILTILQDNYPEFLARKVQLATELPFIRRVCPFNKMHFACIKNTSTVE